VSVLLGAILPMKLIAACERPCLDVPQRRLRRRRPALRPSLDLFAWRANHTGADRQIGYAHARQRRAARKRNLVKLISLLTDSVG
jgi:hypothetical protein